MCLIGGRHPQGPDEFSQLHPAKKTLMAATQHEINFPATMMEQKLHILYYIKMQSTEYYVYMHDRHSGLMFYWHRARELLFSVPFLERKEISALYMLGNGEVVS